MEKYINQFNYLLLLFILSIVLIIISPNVIRILVDWDVLRIVSYCLVIYYHNYIFYNFGIITIIRIGDVGILIAIRIIMIVGRWDLVLFKSVLDLILLIMLATITKRAQIPFSVWLPLAVTAPTPVSFSTFFNFSNCGSVFNNSFNSFLIETLRVILSSISILTIFISIFNYIYRNYS